MPTSQPEEISFEEALQGEHITEAKTHVAVSMIEALNAVGQLNGVREGERIAPNARRWSMLGAGDFFGVHPEVIREAMAATKIAYCLVLDNVGYLDDQALLAIGRWLRDNGK